MNRLFFCGALLLCACTAALHAQTPSSTGIIGGIVHDEDGFFEFIDSAEVTLYANDSLLQTTYTDDDGFYLFEGLPAATYQIRASATGYQTQTIAALTDTATQNIELKALESEIDSTVIAINGIPCLSANAPPLTAAEIAQLPTRSVSSVAATTAGVYQVASGVSIQANGRRKQRKKPPTPLAEAAHPAGQLTAGVISDHNDWKTWQQVVQKELAEHAEGWQCYPTHRYWVQVVNADRLPLPNRLVALKDAQGARLWEARTDNTGRAELWYALFQPEAKAGEGLYLEITEDGFTQTLPKPVLYKKGVNTLVVPAVCTPATRVDIAWVVDATGSMDDEIEYLKAELGDVMRRAQTSQPDLTFEQATVFYKSEGDDYVTKAVDFTQDWTALQTFMEAQVADGGTSEEAVEAGLEAAIHTLHWHDDALTKLLFLVLDEPPAQTPDVVEQLHRLQRQAARQGIRIIPVAASGTNTQTEYLLRAMALATNGHYAFLTDDSGIGDAHAKPTASAYQVELFNDLLVRLIERATVPPSCTAYPVLPLSQALPAVEAAAEAAPQEAPLEGLRLSPNPAIERVRIQIPRGVQELLITDLNGRLLEHWRHTPAGVRFWNVADRPVGLYWIHYLQRGEPKTVQLVVGHP